MQDYYLPVYNCNSGIPVTVLIALCEPTIKNKGKYSANNATTNTGILLQIIGMYQTPHSLETMSHRLKCLPLPIGTCNVRIHLVHRNSKASMILAQSSSKPPTTYTTHHTCHSPLLDGAGAGAGAGAGTPCTPPHHPSPLDGDKLLPMSSGPWTYF